MEEEEGQAEGRWPSWGPGELAHMHPTLNSSVDPLLRSSSPGQRDCLPPASCGRGEALEERSQGGDRVKMSRDEVLPKPDLGPRVEVIDSHLSGDHLPQKIQCTELVRAVLQVCKLPSDFHRFAQRSLKEFRNVEGPFEKRTDLWPCPPPRWRRWTAMHQLSPRRRRRLRFLETRALCLQQLVGHARSPPDYARAGYPMSNQQHLMLERLERPRGYR